MLYYIHFFSKPDTKKARNLAVSRLSVVFAVTLANKKRSQVHTLREH